MNCVSWNCRGLWNPRRVRELSELVKAKSPNLVFLMETKKKNSYLERLRCRLKFDNLFIVPRRNWGGGLALLWMDELNLHIQTFSPRHINAVINLVIDDAWCFTGFYRAPEVANLEDSWFVLRHLASQYNLLWVCIGDFNEIVKVEEKLGGAIRSEKKMQDFRDCQDFYGLKDLGFTGLPFTWCNMRFDGSLVWVRLDRVLATANWILKFPSIRLHHLQGLSSDHKPLWLASDDVNTRFYRPQKPFRFEAMWLKDDRCEEVVHSAWDMCRDGDTKDLLKAESDSMARRGGHARIKALTEEIHKVSAEMNEVLLKPFVEDDVKHTLKQMDANTAPGSDGLPPLFLQTCPRKVSDFRPISLSNVLYKLIAKVLANCLKPLLPNLILETQSTFLSECLITDNVLIAHETLHYLKEKRSGKMGYMALKLDMWKAYDRVEWVYVERIMEKIGFSPRWINLIAACIRTVTYSIMLNGQPFGWITPTSGLRQGDPLSPYLFLLVTEGLHALFEQAEGIGDIRGVSLCPTGPSVSHLLFADNSVVFCRATVSKCVKIQSILYQYEKASGQSINKGKTNIFFSSNTLSRTKEDVSTFLGVPVT
ncbi:uncharacterized protein LOC126722235 [Quercus robur]|uniref:uncharacterized protein LOC126722235 n=1 Tax=Quercus robur TaxID=38942 RepID=UPI002162F101|nr:uncharacterized protein LOC126722235 [Quercus robur]